MVFMLISDVTWFQYYLGNMLKFLHEILQDLQSIIEQYTTFLVKSTLLKILLVI